MEFRVAVTFVILYYIRPQDWVPGLIGQSIIQPFMVLWFLVLVAGRSEESPLKGVMRTPHDWVMLAYLLYVTFTAPDATEAFKGFLPGIAFYFFTVQSVTSWPRLLTYLKWWNFTLIAITVLAILSLYGFDPTNGQTITQQMKGRLSLGTWMHRNPNALGHSVVTVIPLSFALYFWKGGGTGKTVLFPLFATLAFYCLWQTQSKGAYVVGGMVFVLVLLVDKSRILQIIIVCLAITAGFSALNFMPRMNEMGDLRSNEGVIGRLMAWEIARTVSKNEPTGEGWKKFQAIIEWKVRNQRFYIPKATHSSYVQIAADLGRYGLFFYMAALWCALRSLYVTKPSNVLQRRCQLALFLLLASTAVSNWMINREYHTEYYLLIAACAAMHRLKKAEEEALEKAKRPAAVDKESEGPTPEAEVLPRDAGSSGAATTDRSEITADAEGVAKARKKLMWNRFGIIDLAASAALTWLVFLTWDYIMRNI